MPKEVVQKINAAVNKAIADPELAQRLSAQGVAFVGGSVPAAETFLSSRSRPLGQDHQGREHQGRVTMRIVDVHSHWGTKRGYVLRTAAALAQQSRTWRSEPKYDTEDDMAGYMRANGVRAILDFGFTKNLPLDEVVPLHDYALEVQAQYPDAVLGHWLQIDPRLGAAGAAELERCIRASSGFIGYCVSASGMGYTADDPIYGPY